MTVPYHSGHQPHTVALGEIAIVHCAEAFLFEPGNRLRASQCLFCSQMIGDQPAAIIGAAALIGEPCRCGGIVSDVFLIHACHLPTTDAALQAAITRGLQCSLEHQ